MQVIYPVPVYTGIVVIKSAGTSRLFAAQSQLAGIEKGSGSAAAPVPLSPPAAGTPPPATSRSTPLPPRGTPRQCVEARPDTPRADDNYGDNAADSA